MALKSMRREAALRGQAESVVASNGKPRIAAPNRGLSAARGIIIGLGIAGVMWVLLIIGIIRIFSS